jgi:hypothetical protein
MRFGKSNGIGIGMGGRELRTGRLLCLRIELLGLGLWRGVYWDGMWRIIEVYEEE